MKMDKTFTKIRDGRAWTVSISENAAHMYWQSINSKTGKGWQRTRDDQYFRGEKFEEKAMRAWMYAGNKPVAKPN
jgi:hypothetical protein